MSSCAARPLGCVISAPCPTHIATFLGSPPSHLSSVSPLLRLTNNSHPDQAHTHPSGSSPEGKVIALAIMEAPMEACCDGMGHPQLPSMQQFRCPLQSAHHFISQGLLNLPKAVLQERLM
jgi:hypothetical protein